MKPVIALLAIILTFVGYVPYVRDILRRKTHPHTYSWFVWSFLTLAIFALQWQAHGGAGSYVTLFAGIVGFVVFVLGLIYSERDITRSDTFFFLAAVAATAVWLITKQVVLSVTLLVAIDMLGFAPTVRKSWNKPHSETLVMYQVGAFRHSLSLLALSHYSFVTVLFPATWATANLLFSAMLVIRRQRLLS